MGKGYFGWGGISAMLLDASSRDLSSLDGAFGLSANEWTIICYVFAVIFAALGVAHFSFSRDAQTQSTQD